MAHDHEQGGERRTLRRYAADFLTNVSHDEGPLGRRLWLLVRNRSKASTVGRGCCGHPGEPGC